MSFWILIAGAIITPFVLTTGTIGLQRQELTLLARQLAADVGADENGEVFAWGSLDGVRYRIHHASVVSDVTQLLMRTIPDLKVTIPDLDPGITIGPAHRSSCPTGDPEFDRLVAVAGPPWILDQLDSDTRTTLAEMVRAGHRLQAGVWTLRRNPDMIFTTPVIRDALTLAKRWQTRASSSARLALTDPHNDVRVRAMLRLDGAEQNAVARAAAARGGSDTVAALSSPHADEVVAAALLLRDEGGADALGALRTAEARVRGVARETVREAISAIRARAENPGALSVAEGEIGGLSRPSDPAALSVTEPEPAGPGRPG